MRAATAAGAVGATAEAADSGWHQRGRPTGRPLYFWPEKGVRPLKYPLATGTDSGERPAMPMTKRGNKTPTLVEPPSPSPVSPLQGLLEVTRLVRAEENLPELLGAIARTTAESLGYETICLLYTSDAADE